MQFLVEWVARPTSQKHRIFWQSRNGSFGQYILFFLLSLPFGRSNCQNFSSIFSDFGLLCRLKLSNLVAKLTAEVKLELEAVALGQRAARRHFCQHLLHDCVTTAALPPGGDALGLTLFGSARYVSRRDLPFTPDM